MKKKKDGAQGALQLKSLWEPAVYLLPFLLGLAVFVVYPFINVFLISFQNDYNMMTGAFSGLGVENYRKILADPNFLNACAIQHCMWCLWCRCLQPFHWALLLC